MRGKEGDIKWKDLEDESTRRFRDFLPVVADWVIWANSLAGGN